MASRKDRIYRIFAVVLWYLYLESATASNVDCEGKSFYCVNSTHFMICVDLGGGISKTVNDFVIQCPPTTVCNGENDLECTYQLPTTTPSNVHPSDETIESTTNTPLITSLDDSISTSSNTSKTNVTRLFNKNFNEMDITTNANYVPDVQTYKNEVSGISQTLNGDEQLISYDRSNALTVTTDTYSVEILSSKSLDMNSHNGNEPINLTIPLEDIHLFQNNSVSLFTQSGQMISGPSIAANTIDGIETITNSSVGLAFNDNSSFIKLLDTTLDTTIENVSKDASTLTNQKPNTLNTLPQFFQNENSDIVTMSLPEMITTTQATLITDYPKVQKDHNFKNTSPSFKNIITVPQLNEDDQKMHDTLLEFFFTSVKSNLIKDLVPPEENTPKINLEHSTEILNFNRTRIHSDSDSTTETNLAEQTTEIELFNTLSPYELKITEIYNYTNLFTTIEPTITPSEYVLDRNETIVVSTVSDISFNESEMLSKRGSISTVHSPITLKNQVSDDLTSSSAINEMNITSFNYKLMFENSRMTSPDVNEMRKEIQKRVTETETHYAIDNSLTPNDVELEGTSTIITDNIYLDYIIPTTVSPIIIPEFNLSYEKIKDNKIKISHSYEEQISKQSIPGDITTTQANIPNLAVNTTWNNEDWASLFLLTTLESTITSTEYVSGRNEILESTTVSSNNVDGKRILQNKNENQISTSTDNPLPLSYYVSNTDNSTKMKMKTSAINNYISSNEITTMAPHLNIKGASIEAMVTSQNTAEYDKLLPQDENVLYVTTSIIETPYSYKTLKIENGASKSELNSEERIIQDTITYTSSSNDQYMLEASFSKNIPTTIPKTDNILVASKTSPTHFNFTTISLQSNPSKLTVKKQMKDRKKVTESTTISYNNLSHYEIATESSPQVSLNSTQLPNRVTDIEKLVKIEITPTYHYETSTSKSDIQNIMQKILYDKQSENAKSLSSKVSTKYSAVATPEIYNIVIDVKDNKTTIKPKLKPIAVFKNFSEFVTMQNWQLNEGLPLHNSNLNSNITSLYQDGLNTLLNWKNAAFTSTENPNKPKITTSDLNQPTIDSAPNYDNFVEVTTDVTESFSNTNTVFEASYYENPIEMFLPTDVENFKHENESYDKINEYYVDNITTTPHPSIDGTNVTEVITQNHETFNNIMRLTSQYQHNINTEKSLTYDILTPSNPKSIMTTFVTKVDEILLTPNELTTEVVMKNDLTTENPNIMIINTTNNRFQDIYINVTHVRDSAQKFTNTLMGNKIDNFSITNSINTTNKSLFDKPYEHYLSSNKSLLNSENLKQYQVPKSDSPLIKILNSKKVQQNIVQSVGSAYNVADKAKSINVTDDFITEESNIPSVNSTVTQYNTVNDNAKVNSTTESPESDTNSNLLYNIQNNHTHTTNNFHMKNEELNVNYEDQIPSKRLLGTSVCNESTTVYKHKLTTEKIPLNTQVTLDTTSSNIDEIKPVVIKGIDTLYFKSNKINESIKEQNLTEVSVNSTSRSNFLKIPIGHPGSVAAAPYNPIISVLEDSKHVSINANLKQIVHKDDLSLNTTTARYYIADVTDRTKKDEKLSVTPIINVVKKELGNDTNVRAKANKRSTSITVFKCYYRSRGRFADKNNCRKYYICIGKNEPVFGVCPKNTVFSEIKKQCTKNLSHCIRNNQFRCTQEGRFSDVLRSNIYYICVNNNNVYVRFQFQCQNGFHLNKTTVKCVNDIKYQSQISSISIDSNSNKASDQSTDERKPKEKKQTPEDAKYICKEEGKLPDADDCRKYYVCTKSSKSVFRRRIKKCDSDEVFHREKKKCVDRDSYECN